ncbi:MAG TPA: 50S ribosomal protein L3 [Anaerolineae bacterium]|nr:50S ribosomal protein L3 [Anaerolineae bacterium]
MKGILGKKVGMTQIFDDTGEVIPVTIIEVGPCYVTQIKITKRDGYSAIQLGFGQAKRLNKPQRGHLPKGVPDLRYLREITVDDISAYEVGQKIDAGLFAVGDLVDVSGVSKGKGFAGVMKRHGFRGGPRTHGQSDRARAPGSIGTGTTPGRVWKGMRMAGHMGDQRTTVQNLEVVLVDPERNLLAVKGAVPGAKGGLLAVKSAVKGKEK